MVSPATLPAALAVSLASPAAMFEPEAGIVGVGGWVTFRNSTDSAIVIRTTVPSPSTFAGRVAAHAQLAHPTASTRSLPLLRCADR